MKIKVASAIIALAILGGCATKVAPPRDQANACAILDERSKWERPVFAAANQWGISPGTILAFMRQESGFRQNARPLDANGNQRSSAHGYSQALNGTWAQYERARGTGRRDRFEDAADFIGWYLDHIASVARIQKQDARNLYLAYHEGPTGYRRATYQGKPWLIDVANRVGALASIYDGQLRGCESRNMRRFDRIAAR